MIRKLFIVFASGLLLSVLLLSVAWVIGGRDIVNHVDLDNEGGGKGPQATRTLPFDGSQPLAIDGPVSIHYTRGDKSEMIVEGPASVIGQLRLEGGKLILGDKRLWFNDGVDVTITAPRLVGLKLNGASDVELTGLDQPDLQIDASGAVDLDASGRVRKLMVNTSGAGDLDFEKVEAEDATIDVAGVASVGVSASGTVKVAISGAGGVNLHRRPKLLTTSISGVGSVDHDYPAETDAP